jgi:carbon starvation protein CstA
MRDLFSLLLLVFAVFAAYLGVGLPNHPYQVGLAVIALGIAVERGWLPRPKKPVDFLTLGLNAFCLSMVSKIFIGGGVRIPFAWLKVPTLDASLGTWIPKVGVNWTPMPLSTWQIDLTQVQSYLVIVTALTAWLRFQPFASITLLLLILASLPSYVDFDWNWCLPAMAGACVSFYAQARAARSQSRV